MAKKKGIPKVDTTAFTGMLVVLMQVINAACRAGKEPGLGKELQRKLQDVARDCYQVYSLGQEIYGSRLPKLKKICRLDSDSFMALVKSLRANIESSLLLTDPALEPELARRHVEIIVDCGILYGQARCLATPEIVVCEAPRKNVRG